MTHPSIAIIGMACEFPDASQPGQLWENVLARRQSFRPMPETRLSSDYVDPDPNTADKTYNRYAALIEGYHFDRVGFRISAESFRSADMVHWLALDVADRALTDAGYPSAKGLPQEKTGVLLGNTLTGEMTRAATLRLRWPYVSRALDRALEREGRTPQERAAFLEQMEKEYKEPFAEVGGETLAGGLANTIAGRICNYFDLHGGGYILDGACASSLLAVNNACSALVCGDLDVALVGGVDLSLDPFELVGFAKAGALTQDKMFVFDKRSSGFIPGEGCGILVLRRSEDALAAGDRIYAQIRGWGISSDGKGGLTRPETSGQLRAVKRACERAAVAPASIAYYEAHGTGTKVGDQAELSTLIRARHGSGQPASLGSIKANIGHTKAAAGAAALIKATMAVYHQVLPPVTACDQAHALLQENPSELQVSHTGQLWPADREIRAGVSAMGFGGINAHLILDGPDAQRRSALSQEELSLLAPLQEGELFVVSAADSAALETKLSLLAERAQQLSFAELTDLAAHLAKTDLGEPQRAAVVACSPDGLAASLRDLVANLQRGTSHLIDQRRGLFMSRARKNPKLGFLFSGQQAPVFLEPGKLGQRYAWIRDQYLKVFPPGSELKPLHENNQAAVMLASLVGWNLLRDFGLEADLALGHSLGELSALHWAGALNQEQLPATVMCRTCTMYQQGVPGGMTSIAAPAERVAPLLVGRPAVISCYNSPRQTVISGTLSDLDAVEQAASAAGLSATRLSVSHGFHSPLLAHAAPIFLEYMNSLTLAPVARPVFSTITGGRLPTDVDLPELLTSQFVSPVLFHQAFTAADAETDLWIEVGPGRILANLAAQLGNTPAIATRLDKGMGGVLDALAASFVCGAPVQLTALFADRFYRAFDPQPPEFMGNPCEAVPALPVLEKEASEREVLAEPLAKEPLDLIKQLIARQTELPVQGLGDHMRLMDDLHLDSITVAALVAEAARKLERKPPKAPTELANASLMELVQVLTQSPATSVNVEQEAVPRGLEAWVRCFVDDWQEEPLRHNNHGEGTGIAHWYGPDHPIRSLLADGLPAGEHVIVLLPSGQTEPATFLLEAARYLLSHIQVTDFVLLQEGFFAASFARTLALEAPDHRFTVVTLPFDVRAPERVLSELQDHRGFQESFWDDRGVRRLPVLRSFPLAEEGSGLDRLGPEDVILVSGGGKGITAECALGLFQRTGARLSLLGRAEPETDEELATNLARLHHMGCRFEYYSADVTDALAVKTAVGLTQSSLGTVTAILHGAGVNRPKQLAGLQLEDFQATAAPKLAGFQNLLAALRPEQLKLVVTFGSIIARIGLPGEAHYGLANEQLEQGLNELAVAFPSCRCLNLAWSVWSGVGMGERLDSLESLLRAGITPIGTSQGVALFLRLLNDPNQVGTRIVAGRFGCPQTADLRPEEPPFLRFVEQIRVHYPGIELVVDNELSLDNDPYLADHVYEGRYVFPAVMGIEAMSQAAMALLDVAEPPTRMTQLQLERPVIVPAQENLVLRVVVQKRRDGAVEACIRSEETDFHVDHFRARLHFGEEHREDQPPPTTLDLPPLTLTPDDLYGPVFFHGGRFRRIEAYRQLHAHGCCAEITPTGATNWFGRFLPGELIAGDPGKRDAVLHGIQACIPHKSVLPLSCELWTRFREDQGVQTMIARERGCENGIYRYDVDVIGDDGKHNEIWRNLAFKEILARPVTSSWHPILMAPYLQRLLAPRTKNGSVGLLLETATSGENLLRQRLDTITGKMSRRADGKPEAEHGAVSFAYASQLSLAVWGQEPLACDLEKVIRRDPAIWSAMLTEEGAAMARFIARDRHEEEHLAATRVWCARECLKKAGRPLETPLTLQTGITEPGLICFAVEDLEIATLVFPDQSVVIALLYEALDRAAVAAGEVL